MRDAHSASTIRWIHQSAVKVSVSLSLEAGSNGEGDEELDQSTPTSIVHPPNSAEAVGLDGGSCDGNSDLDPPTMEATVEEPSKESVPESKMSTEIEASDSQIRVLTPSEIMRTLPSLTSQSRVEGGDERTCDAIDGIVECDISSSSGDDFSSSSHVHSSCGSSVSDNPCSPGCSISSVFISFLFAVRFCSIIRTPLLSPNTFSPSLFEGGSFCSPCIPFLHRIITFGHYDSLTWFARYPPSTRFPSFGDTFFIVYSVFLLCMSHLSKQLATFSILAWL